MTAVPPEAVTAAAQAVYAKYGAKSRTLSNMIPGIMQAALEAAAPHIAAAERERIRQLAIDNLALCGVAVPDERGDYHTRPFADLIREEERDG